MSTEGRGQQFKGQQESSVRGAVKKESLFNANSSTPMRLPWNQLGSCAVMDSPSLQWSAPLCRLLASLHAAALCPRRQSLLLCSCRTPWPDVSGVSAPAGERQFPSLVENELWVISKEGEVKSFCLTYLFPLYLEFFHSLIFLFEI